MKVLDGIEQSVNIAGKLVGIAAGLTAVAITIAATVIPPKELDFICDHVWSEFKFRHFGIGEEDGRG